MSSLFKLLLTAAFLNALSWIILIPIWQYPDEQAHFAQVQDIAEFGHTPKTGPDTSNEIALSEKILDTERDSLGNNKFTYHPEYKIPYSNTNVGPREKELANLPKETRQNLVKVESTKNPPLYYFLGSISYKLFYDGSLFTRVFAVRFVSLILFLGLIIVAYKIGKIVFDENPLYAIILASLVAVKPMLVFSSTGALPDPLTNLLFATIILISLQTLQFGITAAKVAAMVLVIYLLSLTRQQVFVAIPIVLIPIIYQLFLQRRKLKRLVYPILFFLAIILLLLFSLPSLKFLINFSGPEIGKLNLSLLFTKVFITNVIWTVRHTISEVLPWYWGVYKWLSLTVPHTSYQIINRLIIVAAVGLLVRVYQIAKKSKFEARDLSITFLIVASLIYFLIFLVWDFYFIQMHSFSFGIQGRYFFPLVTAHLAIFLYGLKIIFELIFKRYANLAALILVFLMIIFNDLSLAYVSTSYYDVSNISTFISQASQYKPSLFKNSPILVVILLAFLLQVWYLTQIIIFTKRQLSKT